MDYTLGFLIDKERGRIALIRKEKPDWQKGKLNGIGGKIEVGETPYQCMIREFHEETGATVNNWECFLRLRFRGGIVYCFRAFGIAKLTTMEEERVAWYDIKDSHKELTMKNLKWMIPLAIDTDIESGTLIDRT